MSAPNNRLLALDVIRGITIAGMILVNNPGSWQSVYAPLQHARWHGLTPTDLVYPFFMFIMGVAIHFSLRKFDKLNTTVSLKIIRRTVALFAVGIVSPNFVTALSPGNICVFSVSCNGWHWLMQAEHSWQFLFRRSIILPRQEEFCCYILCCCNVSTDMYIRQTT